jgi:hypothetical protein
METKTTHPRHDSFFRSIFFKPGRTASLLKLAALKNSNLAQFIETIDLNTLKEIPESFTNEGDFGSADLAFTVELKEKGKGAKLLVGLLEEHKSYKDDKVFKQLIRYWHGIMVLKQDNIPTVALILYNGKRPWDPFAEPMFPDYPEYYHQIKLPMIVEFIDVGKDFDEEQARALDPATVFALIIMKHAFSTEGLEKYYASARNVLMEISQEERIALIQQSLLYLSEILRPTDKEFFMDYVTHQEVFGEPSLYEVLQKEGMEQGLQKGMEKGIEKGMQKGIEEGMAKGLREGALEEKRKVALKMLTLHKPVQEIVEISGLTETEIFALKDSLNT